MIMNTHLSRTLYSLFLLGAFLLLMAGSAIFFDNTPPARAATAASSLPIGGPQGGYAWSSFMGWIHFTGKALDGTNYGVSLDTTTNVLSGYAWSPYFGAITFNQADLSGCPSGACIAQISNGKLTGWARSCAVFQNKTQCSGALDPKSGGWDGWIHLSPANGTTYGVTYANNCLSGYAWGSRDVGYISFSGTATNSTSTTPTYQVGNPWCGAACYGQGCTTSTPYSCNYPTLNYDSTTGSLTPDTSQPLYCCATTPNVCPPPPPTVTLTATPSTINLGGSSTLKWTSTNATSCSAAFSSQVSGPQGSVSVSPIVTSSYTVTCTNSAGTGSDTTTVTVNQPTVSITANPDRVNAGDTSTISWTSSLVNNCTVTGPTPNTLFSNSANNPSGTQVTIASQSTYAINCTAPANGNQYSASTTVNLLPKFNEF